MDISARLIASARRKTSALSAKARRYCWDNSSMPSSRPASRSNILTSTRCRFGIRRLLTR